MAMSYTTLTGAKTVEGSIKYFVNHSEVPSASILESAQAMIYSKLRTREMKELLQNVSIAAGASTITLPTRFQDPISLWLDREYRSRLYVLDEEHFEQRVSRDDAGLLYEGTPTLCTIDSTAIYLDTRADREYYYRMWYFRTPAALSGSNETNWLTERYPNLLEAACKFYAYQHREDSENAMRWAEMMQASIQLANDQHDQYQQSIRTELYWDQR